MENMGHYLLMLLSGLSFGFSGTIIKKGAAELKLSGGIFQIIWSIVTTKYILISLFFSGVGYILFMFVVRKAEVITATLIVQGILFASMMVFAALMFREAITLTKILALILIMSGIAVLVAGK
jgi:drug/metabolite transporter (DMT)-like permease